MKVSGSFQQRDFSLSFSDERVGQRVNKMERSQRDRWCNAWATMTRVITKRLKKSINLLEVTVKVLSSYFVLTIVESPIASFWELFRNLPKCICAVLSANGIGMPSRRLWWRPRRERIYRKSKKMWILNRLCKWQCCCFENPKLHMYFEEKLF